MVSPNALEGPKETPKENPKEVLKETLNASPKKTPLVQSLQDLNLVEAIQTGTNDVKYVTFYHITAEEEVYFGQSFKPKREITMEEFNAALEHVPDREIYPEVPEDVPLTIAPDELDDTSAYIKRPGLNSYEYMEKGSTSLAKGLLQETMIMEQLSEAPHPHIVRYFGCHVRRGRITCIVLERLGQTLLQYSDEPDFAQLDKSKFLEVLESTVDYLHSLGLAHNDINPYNIMVRDGMPVLIDFGGCQPFGLPLQEAGSYGWCMDGIRTSEWVHDLYGLVAVREWLETGIRPDE